MSHPYEPHQDPAPACPTCCPWPVGRFLVLQPHGESCSCVGSPRFMAASHDRKRLLYFLFLSFFTFFFPSLPSFLPHFSLFLPPCFLLSLLPFSILFLSLLILPILLFMFPSHSLSSSSPLYSPGRTLPPLTLPSALLLRLHDFRALCFHLFKAREMQQGMCRVRRKRVRKVTAC